VKFAETVLGYPSTLVYDAAGQPVPSINPVLSRTASVYDSAGRAVASVGPLSYRNCMVYDLTLPSRGVVALVAAPRIRELPWSRLLLFCRTCFATLPRPWRDQDEPVQPPEMVPAP
jgi:YD repeat-containing protein